jgi:hypothetical protein
MTTTAIFKDVLAETRTQALKEKLWINLDDQFFASVADPLHLDFSDKSRWMRKDWERFCGQVRRALTALADEGVLVKGLNGGRIIFWTQEAHRAHVRDEADRLASEEASANRRKAVLDRISALNLHGNVGQPAEEIVALRIEIVEKLLSMAEDFQSPTRPPQRDISADSAQPGSLEWHKGVHGWQEHDGHRRHSHSINGALTIDPHDTGLHFKGGRPFEAAGDH